MTEPTAAPPNPSTPPAIEHLTEARRLLNSLRESLDRHPELEQAIERVELALSQLTINTGGML